MATYKNLLPFPITKTHWMQRNMHNKLQPEAWLMSIASVASGGTTAALTLAERISLTLSAIGVLCAVITTIAALVYQKKNLELNRKRTIKEIAKRTAKEIEDK